MTTVTETQIFPLRPRDNGLIAFASALVDGKFSINSIAVRTTASGDLKLLFPSKRLPNGKDVQVFYPITAEGYEAIRGAILAKLEQLNDHLGNSQHVLPSK